MANVVIDVDTSKKSVAVTVDGKKVPDVRDISIYTEVSGYFGVDIASSEDIGDMRRVTRLVAALANKYPDAVASEEFPGMGETEDTDRDNLSKSLNIG